LDITAQGRGTDRKLAFSALMRMMLENGRPEIRAAFQGFKVKNLTLAWAYDLPAALASDRSESAVYDLIHSMLRTTDADVCLRQAIWALVEVKRALGPEGDEIGRYVTVDGTPIPAAREYAKFLSAEAERLARGGLDLAVMASHGPNKVWRGGNLVTITDVKTGLPLGFLLIPGNRPEHENLENLLLRVHALWERFAGEPLRIEYLTADSHFDNRATHEMLEERFGIHPVIPLANVLGTGIPFHENDGVPHCSKHGDMKLVQNEGFVNAGKRIEMGLRPGERSDMSGALARWKCTATENGEPCLVSARIKWATNPRAYPFLPRGGEHITVARLRRVLLRRRNVAESHNARLKGRGIGNGGMNSPRWIRTDNEFKWVCYATLLGFTLQRLVHLNGAYDASLGDAEKLGLLAPVTQSDIALLTQINGELLPLAA
jgi:hypothetical protein